MYMYCFSFAVHVCSSSRSRVTLIDAEEEESLRISSMLRPSSSSSQDDKVLVASKSKRGL